MTGVEELEAEFEEYLTEGWPDETTVADVAEVEWL